MQITREGQFKIPAHAGSRCGAVICLLALMVLTSGCFQSEQPPQTELKPRVTGPNAIWALQKDGAGTSPSAHVVAAEDLPYGIETPAHVSALSVGGESLPSYAAFPAGSQARPFLSARALNIGNDFRYSGNTRSVATLMNSPSTAAVFGKSFGTLFASLFKNGSEETDAVAQAAGDESRNPFREAKQKSDVKPAAPPAKADPAAVSTASPTAPASQAPNSSGPSPSPVQVKPPVESRFIFLGDFDGSGALKLMEAGRVDDTSFSFSDAQRVFNLFINPSSVDQERSLALDDVNGDGLADLLVTSRASVSGGILLGDGNGNFRLVDSFLTGYEPTIATTGASFNGVRDIAALDTRTGSVTIYRAGGRYRLLRTLSLGFLPDYIGHFVSLQDGVNYLMAAQGDNAQDLYKWQDDGTLDVTGATLAGAPSLSYTKDFLSQNVTNLLQVYQIGSCVTVTLDNGRGLSFNVANMRMWPGMFLAIGDLAKDGTLDVAVAYLVSSTAAK